MQQQENEDEEDGDVGDKSSAFISDDYEPKSKKPKTSSSIFDLKVKC